MIAFTNVGESESESESTFHVLMITMRPLPAKTLATSDDDGLAEPNTTFF